MIFRFSMNLGRLGALAAMLVVTAVSAEPSLAPPATFDGIKDPGERSVALFNEAAKVITHPRCMNCHPAVDRPSQGEDSHPHQPPVTRGRDGLGATAMRCTTCHGQANYEPARVPGNSNWHVAPLEMAWQGKTLAAICTQIKDRERNGGRDIDALVKHMAEDELVGWAWQPGGRREPAPGTQTEFGELIKAWVYAGATCPP